MRKVLYFMLALMLVLGFILVTTMPSKAGGGLSITIKKYHDLNKNGVNDGEAGLAGWSFLVEGPGAGGENPPGTYINSITVTTGSDGSFTLYPEPPFESPEPWIYRITEIPREHCINTEPGGGQLWQEVELSGENISGEVEFGNYCTGVTNGDTMGANVWRIDKFGVLAPWLGLGLIIIAGVIWLVIRRIRI